MTAPADPTSTWPLTWGEGLHSRTALLFWLVLKAQSDYDAQALVAAFEADILDIAHHLNDVMLGMDRGHGEDCARGWNAANKALYDKLGGWPVAGDGDAPRMLPPLTSPAAAQAFHPPGHLDRCPGTGLAQAQATGCRRSR